MDHQPSGCGCPLASSAASSHLAPLSHAHLSHTLTLFVSGRFSWVCQGSTRILSREGVPRGVVSSVPPLSYF